MPAPSQSLPVAIVLGGALVGAGLFFGLRSRPAESPPVGPPAIAPQADGPGPSATSPGAPVGPASASGAGTLADRNATTEAVKRAVQAQRALLVEKCWDPAVAGSRSPGAVDYVLRYTFDLAGHEITHEIRENGPAARPEVARCLGETLRPARIAPPGMPSVVDVPFHLP